MYRACQHPDCPSCGPSVRKNKDAFACITDGGTPHCFEFYGKPPTIVELKFEVNTPVYTEFLEELEKNPRLLDEYDQEVKVTVDDEIK